MWRLPFLLFFLIPFTAAAQSEEVSDSLHTTQTWSFDGDSITQQYASIQRYQGGQLVYRSDIGTDERGQPDTTIYQHNYGANGARLRTHEYRSHITECARTRPIAYTDSMWGMYGWMDDKPSVYVAYEPCLIRYNASTNWVGDLAVRTSELHEDSIMRATLDSVWFDDRQRPTRIEKWVNGTKNYSETCEYKVLKDDSIQDVRSIWDNGEQIIWLSKYRIMEGDTIVVYQRFGPDDRNPEVRESFWIYDQRNKQTAYVGKANGRETSRVEITYATNGYVESHVRYENGSINGERERWKWIVSPSITEVIHFTKDQTHYSKTVSQQMDTKKCKWIYSSIVGWSDASVLVPHPDNLRLTQYVEYDLLDRIVFQQNYQNDGQISYQAIHHYEP